MAKNDFEVVACKILSYLYYCLIYSEEFNNQKFLDHVITRKVNQTYLLKVIEMLCDEKLIKGVCFTNVWGGKVIISDLDEMEITMSGIAYLKENDAMKKVRDFILNNSIGYVVEILTRISL